MKKSIAKLKTVSIEVYQKSKGYVWIEGYQVITPEGSPLFPYFKKREAKKFCKESGWGFIII